MLLKRDEVQHSTDATWFNSDARLVLTKVSIRLLNTGGMPARTC